jgi:hypothetical protein
LAFMLQDGHVSVLLTQQHFEASTPPTRLSRDLPRY